MRLKNVLIVMRPLIERDMEETEKILMNSGLLR